MSIQNRICTVGLVLVATFACLSCSEGKGEGKVVRATAASIGQPSEVVLVLDDAILRSDLKDSLEAMLTCNVPGLNQGEDFFRLSRIPVSMDQKEFLKMHSRVLAKVDSKLKEPTLGVAHDVRATPQLQLQVAGPSVDALRPFISQHAERIRQLLLDAQLDNQTHYLKGHASQEVARDLREVLGYTVQVPEEIRFTKKGVDFLWGSSRSQEKQLNVVFYRVPFTGQDLSDVRVLCSIRDSVMAVNIPGSAPDQWMETVWEDERPVVLLRQAEGTTTIRGLWQMRNGAMGGPFVSKVFVEDGSVYFAEGFVFSPQTTKRDLVRRLESALRTFRKVP